MTQHCVICIELVHFVAMKRRNEAHGCPAGRYARCHPSARARQPAMPRERAVLSISAVCARSSHVRVVESNVTGAAMAPRHSPLDIIAAGKGQSLPDGHRSLKELTTVTPTVRLIRTRLVCLRSRARIPSLIRQSRPRLPLSRVVARAALAVTGLPSRGG